MSAVSHRAALSLFLSVDVSATQQTHTEEEKRDCHGRDSRQRADSLSQALSIFITLFLSVFFFETRGGVLTERQVEQGIENNTANERGAEK